MYCPFCSEEVSMQGLQWQEKVCYKCGVKWTVDQLAVYKEYGWADIWRTIPDGVLLVIRDED